MISMENGKTMAYSLFNLQDRGTIFVEPATDIYEGMIIGESNKDQDLTVNATKNKKLTNVRASGTDEALKLTPPKLMTLEEAIDYISEDEYVEVTPESIRLRKKYLTETERKRNKKSKNRISLIIHPYYFSLWINNARRFKYSRFIVRYCSSVNDNW